MKANGMSKNLSLLEEMVEKHRGVPIHLNYISWLTALRKTVYLLRLGQFLSNYRE